jgi:hypothetical protein
MPTLRVTILDGNAPAGSCKDSSVSCSFTPSQYPGFNFGFQATTSKFPVGETLEISVGNFLLPSRINKYNIIQTALDKDIRSPLKMKAPLPPPPLFPPLIPNPMTMPSTSGFQFTYKVDSVPVASQPYTVTDSTGAMIQSGSTDANGNAIVTGASSPATVNIAGHVVAGMTDSELLIIEEVNS